MSIARDAKSNYFLCSDSDVLRDEFNLEVLQTLKENEIVRVSVSDSVQVYPV
jgi:hypothetical protein